MEKYKIEEMMVIVRAGHNEAQYVIMKRFLFWWKPVISKLGCCIGKFDYMGFRKKILCFEDKAQANSVMDMYYKNPLTIYYNGYPISRKLRWSAEPVYVLDMKSQHKFHHDRIYFHSSDLQELKDMIDRKGHWPERGVKCIDQKKMIAEKLKFNYETKQYELG